METKTHPRMVSPRAFASLVVLLLAACARSGGDGVTQPNVPAASGPAAAVSPQASAAPSVTASASGSAATVAVAPSAAPVAAGPAVSSAVLRAVCSHEPCGGDSSLVQVYRDSGGRIGRLYRIYGGCSHSPGIYFSPDGRETALIPERPIVPGSADALAIQKQHDAQTAGLTHTESLRCADGARVAPR